MRQSARHRLAAKLFRTRFPTLVHPRSTVVSMPETPRRGRKRRTPLAETYPQFPFHDEAQMSEEAVKAQRFAVRLMRVIDAHVEAGHCSSMRDFARRVGISHSVIHGYLSGLTWVDGHNLARLEVAVGQPLWDTEPETPMAEKPPYLNWSN